MRAFVLLAVISCAFAAPRNKLQRTKKSPILSSYGCGGGPAVAPVALYLSPGLGGQHYREDEQIELAQREAALIEHHHPHHHHHHQHDGHNEHEHLARSYYEPAAAASIAGLSAAIAPAGPLLAPSAASASASAVFPGAKAGNCAVPLLLSCAPTVISGHIAHSYSAPAYRAQEQDSPNHMNEMASSRALGQAFQTSSLSQQPQMKSWENDEKAAVDEPKLMKAGENEHGFKRAAIDMAASEPAAQISVLSPQQQQQLESLISNERASVSEGKWAQVEQARPLSLERATPLNLPVSHKQLNLEVPKSISDSNVEENINF